jgi:integrase
MVGASCDPPSWWGRIAPAVPKDALGKEPFDEADIALMKRNLDKLTPADQMLVRLVASTGMRLSEALAINGEKVHNGIRFLVVGKKTESSLRRVPTLPAFKRGREAHQQMAR